MARPTKKTPEVEAHIIEALSAGHCRGTAAGLARVGASTLSRWVSEDEDFAQAVHTAESQAVAAALGVITQAAASGTWQAAAWWLERRYPDQWGRNRRADEGLMPETIVIQWADETGPENRLSTRP